MFIPVWALLGLAASLPNALVPLVQERLKTPSLPLVVGNKLFLVLIGAPILYFVGLPSAPLFYVYTALSAVLFAVNDLVYFRVVAQFGAGVVSRLLPISVIFTFFIWFAFDPDLLSKYLSQPWRSAATLAVICFAAYCAMRLRHCQVSWQAIKALWYVLFAATFGPILTKLALAELPAEPGGPLALLAHGVVTYIVFQALGMVLLLSAWWAIRRPLPFAVLREPRTVMASLILALLACAIFGLKNLAFAVADNPAYVTTLLFTDAVWILGIYKVLGRKQDSDIWAGMGLVCCAAFLVLLKSY